MLNFLEDFFLLFDDLMLYLCGSYGCNIAVQLGDKKRTFKFGSKLISFLLRYEGALSNIHNALSGLLNYVKNSIYFWNKMVFETVEEKGR